MLKYILGICCSQYFYTADPAQVVLSLYVPDELVSDNVLQYITYESLDIFISNCFVSKSTKGFTTTRVSIGLIWCSSCISKCTISAYFEIPREFSTRPEEAVNSLWKVQIENWKAVHFAVSLVFWQIGMKTQVDRSISYSAKLLDKVVVLGRSHHYFHEGTASIFRRTLILIKLMPSRLVWKTWKALVTLVGNHENSNLIAELSVIFS